MTVYEEPKDLKEYGLTAAPQGYYYLDKEKKGAVAEILNMWTNYHNLVSENDTINASPVISKCLKCTSITATLRSKFIIVHDSMDSYYDLEYTCTECGEVTHRDLSEREAYKKGMYFKDTPGYNPKEVN